MSLLHLYVCYPKTGIIYAVGGCDLDSIDVLTTRALTAHKLNKCATWRLGCAPNGPCLDPHTSLMLLNVDISRTIKLYLLKESNEER